MEDKNNAVLALRPTTAKLEIQSGDAAESTVSSENQRRTGRTAQRVFVTALDVINHALIILVTSYLAYYAGKQYSITNVHVILCTIGYVLLMSEAFVVLIRGNVLTGGLSHRANKHVHWILQTLGLICTLVGVGFMYNAKTVHFLSIHAITGFSSLVIMCVLAIFGYPVLIAVKLRKFVRPVTVKLVHKFLGLACFVIGIVSQCYGYRKKWVYNVTQTENANVVLLVLTVVIALLSIRDALFSLVSHTLACVRPICRSTSYENMEGASA